MKDKIISKVQKLLSMAHGDAEGGEHERDTAMRMALNLLAKHNLSMLDLEVEKEGRVTVEWDTSWQDPWRRAVANAISKLYFSNFYYANIPGKQRQKFSFVGLESNAITTKEMAQYVIASIYKQAKRLRKDLGETAAFETSFMNAAAGQISQRCKILREEAEAANQGTSTGTGMVLASIYNQELEANEAYIRDQLGLKLKTKPTRMSATNSDGYAAGKEFGSKLNLSKQIVSGKKTTIKIK